MRATVTHEHRDRAKALCRMLLGDSVYPAPWQVDLLAQELADAEARGDTGGYARGRRDFQFEPSGDNHHNAALCPYCSPAPAGGGPCGHPNCEVHGKSPCVGVGCDGRARGGAA